MPVYLVRILFAWAMLGLLSGVGLIILGALLLTGRNPNQDGLQVVFRLIGFLLLFPPGFLLALWGAMMFWQARRIRQNKPTALRWAAGLMIAVEVTTWILVLLCVWNWLLLMFFVVIAVGVSATRIHLWRAVKRMPMKS
ncbi:MAG: hypothetical protein FWD53_08545 [Phycisphaerales bacterium]|nr:hypothetical protein [Phycisphaerales bacterium]